MALKLDTQENGGETVLKAEGDVDLSTSPQLREAILAACKSKADTVVVDLSGVGYMDSSGVATLVEGLKASQGGGKTFALQAPSASVMKVMQLARLDSIFEIRE